MNKRLNRTTSRRLAGSSVIAALAFAATAGCATSERVALQQPDRPARLRVSPAVQPKTAVKVDRTVEHAVVDEKRPATGAIEQMTFDDETHRDRIAPRSVEAVGFVASGQSPETFGKPISYAPVPRSPVTPACPPGMPCPPTFGAVGPHEEPPYPEELLCDGGDAGHPFHYEGTNVAGLEPEDTVAEFTDHEGTAHVRIASRACVYAPKFGAVRSISQPLQDYTVDVLGGAHRSDKAAGFEDQRPLIMTESVDQLADVHVREEAVDMMSDIIEGAMHQTVGIEQHIKLQNAFEDYQSLSEGQFHQTTEAYLASTVQIAGETIREIGPIIVANDVFGQAVTSVDSAQVYTASEDRRRPGDLRVVKLADQQAAQPGDEITFRIRFYNDGGRELQTVRILDHLSPRLEYVEGSASSELEGRLTVDHDDYGGQLLRFELGAPLEGGTSGEISFRAVAK